jgi:hypothetical protein
MSKPSASSKIVGLLLVGLLTAGLLVRCSLVG